MKKFLRVIAAALVVFMIGGVIISRMLSPVSLSKEYINSLIESKSIENISWEDFEHFEHQDVGHGNYVFQYPLADGAYLYLSGADLKSPPMFIYIVDENGNITDLKNENEIIH